MKFEFSITDFDHSSPLIPLSPKIIYDLERRAYVHYPNSKDRMKGERIVTDPYLKDVEPLIYNRRVESTSRKYYAGDPLHFYAHFFCADFRDRPTVWNHQESFSLRERVRNREGFNSFWFHTK